MQPAAGETQSGGRLVPALSSASRPGAVPPLVDRKSFFAHARENKGRKKAEKEPSHAKIRSRGSGHVKKRLLNKMRKDLRPAEPERYRAGPTQIGPSPKPVARDSRRTRLRIFSCCFSTFVRLLFDFCGRALLRRSARLRCGTLLARLIHPLLFPKRRVLLGLSRLHAASRDAAWLCLVPGGFTKLPLAGNAFEDFGFISLQPAWASAADFRRSLLFLTAPSCASEGCRRL